MLIVLSICRGFCVAALVLSAALAGTSNVASAAVAVPTHGQQRIEAGALQAEAMRAVSGWLKAQPVSRFEIAPAAPLADLRVPGGPWTLSARPLAAALPPVGRVIAWVEVSVGGRIERRVPVAIDIHSFAQRWHARADLPARAPVAADAFELREAELSTPYQPSPSDLPPGMRLSRPLAAGQPLQSTHMEPAVEVTRGDIVSAYVRRGMVSVQSRAEALQDGRSGQRVQVRIAGATGPVQALVTGPGTVEVNE